MTTNSEALQTKNRSGKVARPVVSKPRYLVREARFGFLLILPALLFFVAIILFPFLRSFGLSFFESTLFNENPNFVGLENFIRLFADAQFRATLVTTFIYVTVTTVFTVVLGFIWALILNQTFSGRTIVRTATLLPWVLPTTVTAFLWAWIYNGQFGLLNAALEAVGLIDEPIVWLSNSRFALFSVILTKVWISTPVAMSFLLAALQSVSSEEIDASVMDGCGAGGIVRHVVFPHIFPTLVIVLVIQAMANLQQIDTILAMTSGGPVRATNVLSIEVYRRAFQEWNMGLASAIGVIWFFTIAIPTAVYLRSIFRRSDL